MQYIAQMNDLDRTLFLRTLGQRIREQRQLMRKTLREVASDSGVSLRFLTSLEAGEGNISVVKLAQVCSALRLPMHSLFDFETGDSQAGIVALLGLRGAGKSTIGAMLAEKTGRPFFELDELIEETAGLQLAEIFSLHGESYYRKVEREALEALIENTPHAILATGGGIVTEEDTFQLLRNRCVTVWLRAQPEDHMSRVLAQGDQRPIAGRPHAMTELKTLLTSREKLYGQAAFVVDTSDQPPSSTLTTLLENLESHGNIPMKVPVVS